jgi:hypothetical protein
VGMSWSFGHQFSRPFSVSECPLWVKSRHSRCNKSCPLYPRKRTLAGSLLRLTGGPLIVVTGINVTAAFALEEVHIASLFAPFNSLPKLQFAATTRTRARIGTGGLHRTDVAHGGQTAL